ncbi:hypothetical protein NSS79_23550 [Paenibacillus sp. FSL L8-0436]|uniref:hypothetical protein n=1 Tax=Paenibacillus sp. FSL L8-0436 TaxID=2954686 RepID=UPI003158BA7C
MEDVKEIIVNPSIKKYHQYDKINFAVPEKKELENISAACGINYKRTYHFKLLVTLL